MKKKIYLGINILIAIDSENYNKELLPLLPKIFDNQKIHIAVMGKTAKQFINYIPDGVESKYTIQCPAYNYPLAINLMLRNIATVSNREELVVISDGWSVFNLNQILRYNLKDIDFSNEFISIDNFQNNRGGVNLESEKLMLSIQRRAIALANDPNNVPYVPIVVSSILNLTEIENGLNEELFTELSRMRLIEQLTNIGLKERKSPVDPSIAFKFENEIANPMIKLDRKLINELNTTHDHVVFIPSNYGIDWGSTSKIKYLVSEGGIYSWSLKIPRATKRLPTTKSVVNTQVKELQSTPNNFKKKSPPLQPRINRRPPIENLKAKSNKKTLILVHTGLEHLISITPLIKKIYEENQIPIDVLTNNKLDDAVPVLQSFMVNKIYDLSDVNNRLVNFKIYDRIINTINCRISIPNAHKGKLVEANGSSFDLISSNYKILDYTLTSPIPDPYCFFNPNKKFLMPHTLVIGYTTHKKYVNNGWKDLGLLTNMLSNNQSFTIVLLGLKNELPIFDVSNYKLKKNVHVLPNVGCLDACGISRSASVLITDGCSKLSWLGYSSKSNMILIENDITNVPHSNSYYKLTVNRGTLVKDVRDLIIQSI